MPLFSLAHVNKYDIGSCLNVKEGDVISALMDTRFYDYLGVLIHEKLGLKLVLGSYS